MPRLARSHRDQSGDGSSQCHGTPDGGPCGESLRQEHADATTGTRAMSDAPAILNSAAPPAALREVTLEDKYRVTAGRVFVSGNQVLVRLPIEQRRRDVAVGRNT